MKYPISTLTPFGRFRAMVYRFIKRPYLFTGLVAYSFVALVIVLYLNKSPRFTSEMELVLPGTGSSNSISLDDVGQVVSQTSAPFAAGGFNPRINYKEMLSSRGVRERAAKSLELTLEDFGEAKVSLTIQTSIIAFAITGRSEEQAHAKAWALYQALQDELDHLRADEVFRRDESIKHVLDQYREKMNTTRRAIVDFQQRSMLVSVGQMDQMLNTLATVKDRQLQTRAEVKRLNQYINQLSLDLGVSPKLAGQAFALQSDVEFRAYLGELDTSVSQLTEFSSRWGVNHPKVIAQQKRLANTRVAIKSRSTALFGLHTSEIFNTLNLDLNPNRARLFANLIEAYATQEGQVSMLSDLERSGEHLGDQLKVFSREVVELERLQREFNMAEAVFTSAAASLEASKADVFASYPVLQMLTTPSYPLKSSSPNIMIAIVAACAGIFLITFGLIVLWQRNKIIRLLLKKN
jgi:uncharacterized protein involved in exopolysaccharide biosynthesis